MRLARWLGGMAVVFTVSALSVGDAHAGLKSIGALVVTATSARGQFATIRASSDSVQFLTCEITTDTDELGVFTHVLCSAKSAAGTQRACGSFDAEVIAAARAITGDSYVEFVLDQNLNCKRLLVENGSALRPKEP